MKTAFLTKFQEKNKSFNAGPKFGLISKAKPSGFMMRQLKIVPNITDRSEDSVSRYLLEISRIDLLHRDEELNLAIRARNGDHKALEKLIKTNLRFVVSVAKQYQNTGMSLSDLISEGNLGLIKAAHRYDYTKGFRFISFAVYWIRQFIIQGISDQKRTIRLPGNQIANMNKVSKATNKLEQQLERPPSVSEIAELMELTEDKVAEIVSGSAVSISVDGRGDVFSEQRPLLDTLVNENALCPVDHLLKGSLTDDLIRMLNRLPQKQGMVLKYWYGIDGYSQRGYDEIALQIGLTSERVRQLRSKAIEALGRMCKVYKMAEYFNIK